MIPLLIPLLNGLLNRWLNTPMMGSLNRAFCRGFRLCRRGALLILGFRVRGWRGAIRDGDLEVVEEAGGNRFEKYELTFLRTQYGGFGVGIGEEGSFESRSWSGCCCGRGQEGGLWDADGAGFGFIGEVGDGDGGNREFGAAGDEADLFQAPGGVERVEIWTRFLEPGGPERCCGMVGVDEEVALRGGKGKDEFLGIIVAAVPRVVREAIGVPIAFSGDAVVPIGDVLAFLNAAEGNSKELLLGRAG